jgi:hypothetical protein
MRQGAEAAAEALRRLWRITRVEERHWGPYLSPTIALDASPREQEALVEPAAER